MSNEQELNRLQAEAQQIENDLQPGPLPGQGGPVVEAQPLDVEIADTLDIVAMACGMLLPTVPQRFTHDQNLRIAGAMCKLAEKYGYDLRAAFIGQDSAVFLWLNLAFAVGVPLKLCADDYKVAKARAVEAEKPAAGGDGVAGDE